MKDVYETLRGKVTLLYNEKGCRAFGVKCELGNFTVIDYVVQPLDREIYWDNASCNKLNTASEEYDVASALVNGYIQGIHEKLKPEDREKWPVVKYNTSQL